MNPEEMNERLSKISTVWSLLGHAQTGSEKTAAQRLLMERYGGAVRRYLLGALRDADAADELAQEFALSLVRGEFAGADPRRGRFRDYVKAVLFHLVSKFRKRQQKLPKAVPPDGPILAELPASEEECDRQFQGDWRAELLARAWQALADAQPTLHAALRFRADHPALSSEELAQRFGPRRGQPMTAAAFRQALHRARDRFAVLLYEEAARSLRTPTLEQVEEELRALNLLAYCRSASPGKP
jgi:RNA polymerase sigma-70 factor (ECF subfamily)